jgi:hypothetical protein
MDRGPSAADSLDADDGTRRERDRGRDRRPQGGGGGAAASSSGGGGGSGGGGERRQWRGSHQADAREQEEQRKRREDDRTRQLAERQQLVAASPAQLEARRQDAEEAAPARTRGSDTDEQWKSEIEKMKVLMQEETSDLRAVLASLSQAMEISKRASAEMRQDLRVVKRQALFTLVTQAEAERRSNATSIWAKGLPLEAKISANKEWLGWFCSETGIKEGDVHYYCYNDAGRAARNVKIEFKESWQRTLYLQRCWERRFWEFAGAGPGNRTLHSQVRFEPVVGSLERLKQQPLRCLMQCCDAASEAGDLPQDFNRYIRPAWKNQSIERQETNGEWVTLILVKFSMVNASCTIYADETLVEVINDYWFESWNVIKGYSREEEQDRDKGKGKGKEKGKEKGTGKKGKPPAEAEAMEELRQLEYPFEVSLCRVVSWRDDELEEPESRREATLATPNPKRTRTD